jgi:Leucine-rich repeat (LRR) protein
LRTDALIGILHVDYESLIPYLSESIKQNFKDITDVKADTKQIHRLIDMMYAEFITKDKKKNDRKSTSVASKQQIRSRSLRWIIGTSLGVLLLVSLAVALVFLLPFMNGSNVDNPSNPSSPSTSRAPTSPSDSPVPFTGIPSVDQEALVELYYATHGPGWRSLASPSTSVCEWGGVVCDGNGRVFDIDMEHSNMWGTIPDSIGTLKYLRSLRLASNALSGTIPASIGNLTNLNELIIADAQFNGTVPVEIFSLPFLEKLLIGDNPNLSWTIPPQIGNLKRLQSFSARNTGLRGTIPDEISQLKKLKFLVLDSNNLTGTVPSLKSAPLLIQLYLYDNQLTGTIPFIPGGYIGALDLSGNKFSGTVENLERARPFSTTPTEIGLAMNNLSGEFYLPKQIMENSDYIHINDNNFTSLSPKLANVTLLGGCRANNNPFRCPIPEWFRTGCQATCV